MNVQTNAILASLLQHLEAKQSKAVCEECGGPLNQNEAKKAGDGQMLCEECWGKMQGEAVESDEDVFSFYEWVGGNEFVEKSEKGPVVARVPSESNPEKEYEIRLGADGNFYCSCPAWKYQKKGVKERTCKHIKAWAKAHDMKMGEGDELVLADGEVMVLEMATEDVAALLQESGEKFKKLTKELAAKGVDDPKALAAWIGRKKLGKEEFQRRAAAGRKESVEGCNCGGVTEARSIGAIAQDIKADWKNVYFGAVPYLSAMMSLDKMSDSYGDDDARSIVTYFLGNAKTWKGPKAKEIKAELKALLK